MTASTTDPSVIAEARRLFAAGWAVKSIADKLGVPRTNLYRWFGLHRPREDEPDPSARTVEDYRDELVAFRDFFDDIHVRLLGDPPLHRSALWPRIVQLYDPDDQ
ncbi:MAG: hypothetical protein P4M09_11035 [Devosia sp.]|nr:hypothetical protein [Devosia sp.]